MGDRAVKRNLEIATYFPKFEIKCIFEAWHAENVLADLKRKARLPDKSAVFDSIPYPETRCVISAPMTISRGSCPNWDLRDVCRSSLLLERTAAFLPKRKIAEKSRLTPPRKKTGVFLVRV